MKLHEIRSIEEATLETKDIETLWTEQGDGATEFTSVAAYMVRPMPKISPTRYEAFSVTGGKRKPFGQYNSAELDKVLAPIRPDQKPDAEGFTTYVDPLKTEAFQYSGEPIIVLADDEEVKVRKGDYITRRVDGKNFTYAVETKAEFESTLKAA